MNTLSAETLRNFADLGLIDQDCIEIFSNNLKYILGGTALGSAGGLILANKIIRDREESLGRPLSKLEKRDIYTKYIGGGAGIGTLGGMASNSFIDKDNLAIDKGVDKIFDKFNKAAKTKKRLEYRFLKGISYKDQDSYKKLKEELLNLGESARHKSLDQLSAKELTAIKYLQDKQKERGNLRQAMITGGGLMAYNKIIKPLIQKYKNTNKSKLTDDQLISIAVNLKKEGKSTEEIKEILDKLVYGK